MRKIVSVILTCSAALLASAAGLSMADQSPPASGQSLTPLADNTWDYVKARHLLFRAGFGGRPEEVERLHALGLRKAVDFLVDYKSQPDVALPPPEAPKDEVSETALSKLSPEDRQKAQQQKRRNDQLHFQAIRQWWVKRMVESPRPLEEKLVLFWHGHFATEFRTVRNSEAMLRQNQLFWEHAAGNYGKLLHGIVHDPAMLRYLDNNTNVKGKPNENLAREIMELFAMGVDQGYTQADIREAARALTGYTYDHHSGQFRYVAAQHDDGPKTIFGKCGNWTGTIDACIQHAAAAEQPDPRTLKQLKVDRDRVDREIKFILQNPGETELDQDESQQALKRCRARRAQVDAKIAEAESQLQRPAKAPSLELLSFSYEQARILIS
jgi:uncharacterized protein DUF1800